MADFAPIAIVGHACVVPGALTPDQLWDLVATGRTALGPPPKGRWRADIERLKISPEGVATERGGYVVGFEEAFDYSAFAISRDRLVGLEPMYRWLLHVGHEALITAGFDRSAGGLARTGAIFGNLLYPTEGLSELAEAAWLGSRAKSRNIDQRNRFSSGYPVHFLCQTLGLGAGGFALDAACASSLYAIKLACDWLADGRADAMLAGGVNAGDFLGLSLGFTALNALSRTGQSRPFHAEADGLLPAEGAAAVVLKRLEDAVAANDDILGVIRAVGLSNDGRTGGFLAPSHDGQVRALHEAYALSGISPERISLLECHATGTALGDAAEIRSTTQIFKGLDPVPIGSLKSNLGHLTTASGAAGLIKMLMAMRHRVRPPTLHARPVNAALDGAPFRVLDAAEDWESKGPRCAAVSAFGFGGNNAHLVVEEWSSNALAPKRRPPPRPVPIAAVGLVIHAGPWSTREAELQFFAGEPGQAVKIDDIRLPVAGLRAPPLDLAHALPQQVLMLQVMLEAVAATSSLPLSRTGVLVGMGCDPDAARHFLRARLPDLTSGAMADAASVPRLDAAGVVGAMGNILANRLNAQCDMRGLGFSVAAEEASGIRALEIAMRALTVGDLDAAVVGAVDLSDEPVHGGAAQAVLPVDRHIPGDAACALTLKRLDDARRDGDDIIGIFEMGDRDAKAIDWSPYARRHRECFGHAHAADGLLQLCCAILSVRKGVLPRLGRRGASPWLAGERRSVSVTVESLGGEPLSIVAREADRRVFLPHRPASGSPIVVAYGGRTLHELGSALAQGEPMSPANLPVGPRIVIVTTEAERQRDLAIALDHVKARQEGRSPPDLPATIVFRFAPVVGEVAFVFTGAAAAYPGMGRELLLALPGLAESLRRRIGGALNLAQWVYFDQLEEIDGFSQLIGASMLCQAHADFSRLIELRPSAAIGLSSGETNALFALDAWKDMGSFIEELARSDLYSRRLGGALDDVRTYWRAHGIQGRRWTAYTIRASREVVENAISQERSVHLLILASPNEVVIGGEEDACRQIVDRVGAARAVPLTMKLAVHCPELTPCAPLWRRLHRRAVRQPNGIRFYFNAFGEARALDAETVADALLRQALDTVDFPRTVRRAWEDGARIFVEHGPRDQCARWIAETLGEREHLVIAYDVLGRSSLNQALIATAKLAAAGVAVNLEGLTTALANGAPRAESVTEQAISFPGHRPPVSLVGPACVDIGPTDDASSRQMLATSDPRCETMASAPQLAAPSRTFAFNCAPAAWKSEPESMLPPAEYAGATEDSSPTQDDDHSVGAPTVSAMLVEAVHATVTGRHLEYLRQVTDLSSAFQRLQAQFIVTCAGSQQEITSDPDVAAICPLQQEKFAEPQQGPSFDRRQLETLASGRISTVLGPMFKTQDQFVRQVRLPMPPLLLIDRVTGMTGEPGSMGAGTIWTETEIHPSAWYLHQQRMPAGITIECGQADLLLISWLGADFHNRGERAYRLLGCDLTFFDGLPQVGDTLKFDIHVDDHAELGRLRLFSFHYDLRVDGRLRMSVRNGQAGFFTDEEMAKSEGVLWKPAAPVSGTSGNAQPEVFAPVRNKSRFTEADVRAFSQGRISDCFGPGYELAECHTRTPRLPFGKMLLIRDAPVFDPAGGPWRRGYLRADWPVSPQDWFFEGHFKNDPCMPGTLMLEACLQAMAMCMTAMGLTLRRDGWRFEPACNETFRLRCRGQVTPNSRRIAYDVFVSEVVESPIPSLKADVLATVDGLKAFQCSGLTLQLRPGWPLDEQRDELEEPTGMRPPARHGALSFDYRAMLSSALGRPSDAFGAFYKKFDGHARVPRLPAPPYLFMSSVSRIEGEMGAMAAGAVVEAEYAIPANAWYFHANGARVMPFCALLEAALQPCGWLASYSGFAVNANEDLFFRNLDGKATIHAEVGPDDRILTTCAKLVSVSQIGATVIVGFETRTSAGDQLVMELATVFGFFPAEALALQPGLPSSESETATLSEKASEIVMLNSLSPRLFGGTARVARFPLLLLDRVSGWWPRGGTAALGRIKAEKDVRPSDWFFKAHFFQDPVQPGSLGIEAMLQLLQVHMLRAGLTEGLHEPRFEPIAAGQTAIWKYRGQVTPLNSKVTVLLDILEQEKTQRGAFAKAVGSLWVDGKKIYEVQTLAMRARSDASMTIASQSSVPATYLSEVVDLTTTPWIADHCPTYVIPCLPMMWVVDRLAQAASGARPDRTLVELTDIRLYRWLSLLDGRPLNIRAVLPKTSAPNCVEILLEAAQGAAEDSSFSPAARGFARFAERRAPQPDVMPMTELGHRVDGGRLYAEGTLFHGPSFHVLRELRRCREGAVAVLDAKPEGAPTGILNPALLDGVAQIGSITDLGNWFDLDPAFAPYPARIETLQLFGPVPSHGLVECRIRRRGFADDAGRLPRFDAQLITGRQVLVQIELAYTLFPKGPLGSGSAGRRRAFLKQKRAIWSMGLGRTIGRSTVVGPADIERSDWLKGSVTSVYGCSGLKGSDALEAVAVKQHVAQAADIHPFHVVHDVRNGIVASGRLPFYRHPVTVTRTSEGCHVADAAPPYLDLTAVEDFWRRREQLEDSVMFDLLLGLIRCFVRKFETDGGQMQLKGRPALYLANHQTYLEGFLFNAMASAHFEVPIRTIIKTEHRTGWVAAIDAFAEREPGTRHANAYYYFDQSDPRLLFSILDAFAALQAKEPHSLMVFVEGRRARSAKERVSRIGSVLPDFAVRMGMPVVPLRMSGGLPLDPSGRKNDFPFSFGRQDYVLGAPIEAVELGSLTGKERAKLIVDAINDLPPGEDEAPLPPCNSDFVERIRARAAARQSDSNADIKAALIETFISSNSGNRRTQCIISALNSNMKDDPGDVWARSLAAWLLSEGSGQAFECKPSSD